MEFVTISTTGNASDFGDITGALVQILVLQTLIVTVVFDKYE